VAPGSRFTALAEPLGEEIARRPTTDGSSGVPPRNGVDDIFNRVALRDKSWHCRLAADAEAALHMCSAEAREASLP
jgi:hypothetical protein